MMKVEATTGDASGATPPEQKMPSITHVNKVTTCPGRLRPDEKVDDTLSYWKFQKLLKTVPSYDNMRVPVGNENSLMHTSRATSTKTSTTTRQRRTNGAIHSYLEDSKGKAQMSALAYGAQTGTCPDRELWKLISKRRWEWAAERLNTHPCEAEQFLSVESLPPPSSPSETGVATVLEPTQAGQYNKVLPLHLACSTRPVPPAWIIKLLIDTYPQAISIRSADGYLPIQYAVNLLPSAANDVVGTNDVESTPDDILDQKNDQNHTDMIRVLLLADPSSITSPANTPDAMRPLHIAAATAKSVNAVLSPVHTEIFNLMLSSTTVTLANMDPLSLVTMKDSQDMTPIDYAWEQAKVSADQQTEGRQISVPEKYLHPLLKSEIRQHILISKMSSKNIMEGKTRSKSKTLKSNSNSRPKTSKMVKTTPLLSPVPELRRTTNDHLEKRLRILQEKLKTYLNDDDDDDNNDRKNDVHDGEMNENGETDRRDDCDSDFF